MRPSRLSSRKLAAATGEFGTHVASMLVQGGDVPMVKTLDAGRGARESHFTQDDPPLKVIWFWVSLIAVSAITILFVWPSEGTGEYHPIGEYYTDSESYFYDSEGYYRQELPNPNFNVQRIVTFLIAGFLGGAVVKLSLAALNMRDSSKSASLMAIVGAALAAAFVLKILPDPGAKLAKFPLNDFPFILLFIFSLVPVIPAKLFVFFFVGVTEKWQCFFDGQLIRGDFIYADHGLSATKSTSQSGSEFEWPSHAQRNQ